MPVGMQPVNQVSAALVLSYALTTEFRHTSIAFRHFINGSLSFISLLLNWPLYWSLFPHRSLPPFYNRSSVRCFDSSAWTALPMAQVIYFTPHHLWKNMYLITQLLHGTKCDARSDAMKDWSWLHKISSYSFNNLVNIAGYCLSPPVTQFRF